MFGSYKLKNFKSFNVLIENCSIILNDKDIDFKHTGHNLVNRFCLIEKEYNNELESFLNKTHNTNYEWTFEYFHSAAPVGLHTDYDRKVYSRGGHFEIVAGFIAPCTWTCKQPYTINYNKEQSEPRKLIYKQGHMRYLDNNEIIDYRINKNITSDIENYIPKECEMYEQMQDIEIQDVYKWEVGTYMLFDTRRWHSSSWYSSSNKYKDLDLTEYKRSIIGFATVSV